MSINYCCYGAYADVGCSADCPTKRKGQDPMTDTQPTLRDQLQALLDSGAPNLHFEFLPGDLRRVISALGARPADTTQAQAHPTPEQFLKIAAKGDINKTCDAYDYLYGAYLAANSFVALARPAQAAVETGPFISAMFAPRAAISNPPQPEAQSVCVACGATAAIQCRRGAEGFALPSGSPPPLCAAIAQQPAPSAEAGREVRGLGRPTAWLRASDINDPQPHAVTDLKYRAAADAAAGVEYVPVYTVSVLSEAERKTEFYTGVCVALTCVVGFDSAVLWGEIVKTCGDDLLYHAAHVEPDEWQLAGFAKYAWSELQRRKPRRKEQS